MTFEKDDELIQAMHEAVDAECQKAANILREKYVIPFCDTYGFRFKQGNGIHIFVCMDTDEIHHECRPEDIDHMFEDGSMGGPEVRDAAHAINNARTTVSEILGDGPVGNHFGWDSWMEDYTPC